MALPVNFTEASYSALACALIVILLSLYYIYCKLRVRVPLRDKVVVITGASSGLGEACAKVFHESGCKVVLCARRKDELDRVKTSLLSRKAAVHEPLVVVMDITESESIMDAFDSIVKSCGRIDILINNAGIVARGAILELGTEIYRKVMEVNFFGLITLTKVVMDHMVQKKINGSMVAISSLQGRLILPYRSPYSASKHALQAYCDCLRAEVAEYDIHIGVVSPGYVDTPIAANSLLSDGSTLGVERSHNSQNSRGMTPEYVAYKVRDVVEYRYDELMVAPLYDKLGVFVRANWSWYFFRHMRNHASKVDKQTFDVL